MRRWLVELLLVIGPLLIGPLLTGPVAFAQQAVPSIAFDSVPNPLHLPANMYFGEVSGVSVNSKGHVFVLSRGNTSGPAYAAAATQLLEFDAKGQFIREIGKNLYAWSFGHTVKVDPQDNVWVTDKGSDMVIKFDPEGRVVMVFGRKQEASDEDTEPLKHPKPPLPAEDGRFRQCGRRHVPPGVRRGRSASYRRRIRCCTARTPGPAASTGSRSTARCSACSANPASSSSNSAGSTRWPARRKT